MRAARTVTDPRPLPVRLAEAELDLHVVRRQLLDVERRLFELSEDIDPEALDLERDDVLRQLDWTRMRRDLLHDETTEHLVPEELRFRPQRAA